MKRRIAVLALAVVFFGLPGSGPRPVLAQSAVSPAAGDLPTRVGSIVDRFPGETSAATSALAAELVVPGARPACPGPALSSCRRAPGTTPRPDSP